MKKDFWFWITFIIPIILVILAFYNEDFFYHLWISAIIISVIGLIITIKSKDEQETEEIGVTNPYEDTEN